jgi:hypothetical protein
MAHADECALTSLKRSALITRAFGLANPFFDGGRDRAEALLARFFLYTQEIEHLEGQRGPRSGAAAGEGKHDG